MMQTSANLNVMVKAARKAGRSLMKDFQEVENLQVSVKGAGDFVTKADIAAEKIIKDELLQARPTYGWIGEESGEIEGTDPTRRWIVDPLDGTTNFCMDCRIGRYLLRSNTRGRSLLAWFMTRLKTNCFSPRRAAGLG